MSENPSLNRKAGTTRILAECAIMIAAGTVLSLIKIDMPMGGGLTLCSMLPLVVLSYRRGIKWGLFAAFAHSLLQMLLGIDNLRYATGFVMAAAIMLLDYLLAYTVLGLAGIFRGRFNSAGREMALGAALTIFVRFVCHFLSGWMIWDALWPNEFGLAAPLYSLCYNGLYMLPELLITAVASLLIGDRALFGLDQK